MNTMNYVEANNEADIDQNEIATSPQKAMVYLLHSNLFLYFITYYC